MQIREARERDADDVGGAALGKRNWPRRARGLAHSDPGANTVIPSPGG